MYYCIKCNELHENMTANNIFRTGFFTLQDQITTPLGICREQIISTSA
jgi:hypothetical protein